MYYFYGVVCIFCLPVAVAFCRPTKPHFFISKPEKRTERNVKNKTGIFFVCGVGFLAAFALWTIAVGCVDVQPNGPDGSALRKFQQR